MTKYFEILKKEIKHSLYLLIGNCLFRNGVKRVINGESIRFPFEYSRYYPTDYEVFKQNFIAKHASGNCVDLGAHIGLYTVLMSRKADQVIAFEPTNYTRKICEQTIKLNRCNNVRLRSEVVAEQTGQADFYDTGNRVSNANSLVPVGTPTQMHSLALDDLCLSIDFLKIDIEGAELLALKGARNVLGSLKYMTIEIHPSLLLKIGQNVEEIFQLLESFEPVYFFQGIVATPEELSRITEHFEVNIVLNGSPIHT
jgi:FkbM family methyltransferase